MKVKFALLLVLLMAEIPAVGQYMSTVATGTPWMGSFGGGPDDVNLGNLNVNWTFPLINKPGRGVPYVLAPTYDSSVWYPATSGSAKSWQPISTSFGWNGLPGASDGYITYTTPAPLGPFPCGPPVNGNQYYYEYFQQQYTNYVFVDSKGTAHPTQTGFYTWQDYEGPEGCYQVNENGNSGDVGGYTSDGSGYYLTAYPTGGGWASNAKGVTLALGGPSGGYQEDINGNYIYCGSTSCTDTLGQTAMSVTGSPNNSPVTITGPGGSEFKVNYSPKWVQTKFNCPNISEFGPTQYDLPTSIQLPDGREYLIAYEPTPGASSNVTGRIASITLVTDSSGPTITYAYTGGGSGVNGIECSDGSTPALTRTTPDGQWTYSRSYSSPVWTTTITDPLSDKTNVAFVTSTGTPTNFYEIGRQINSGASTLKETILTCYSTSPSSCPTSYSSAISGAQSNPAVGAIVVTNQFPSNTGISSGYSIQYNLDGLPTLQETYDFGTVGSGAFSTNPIQIHGTSYYITGNMTDSTTGVKFGDVDRVFQDYIVNGYATPWAPLTYTQNNFDGSSTTASSAPQHSTGICPSGSCALGNVTSTYKWVSGGNPLTANSGNGLTSCTAPGCETLTYTNYDTGLVNVATDVNGETATYAYNGTGGCADAFPTSVASTTGNSNVPTLTTTATWNCGLGVQATAVDANGLTTTYGYTTSYGKEEFGRPTKITSAANAITNITYPSSSSPATTTTAMTFNSSTSTSTSVITVDSLGRTIDQQTAQGPGTGVSYDTISTTYDSLGRVSFVTVPCSESTEGGACPGSGSGPGTTTAYDALSRTTQVTDGGTGYVSYTYQSSSNDVLVTVGPQTTQPSSENLKKRQLQYNGAGWLTSVCEITSSLSGHGACGQTTSATGFLTNYSYDSAGRLTQSQQNAQPGSSGVQTRTVAYDALSRKTSETIPEWSARTGSGGTATYTYDYIASGNCSGTSAGDMIKSVDAAGDVTCYTYDLLHRLLSTKVVAGTYADPTTPQSHYVYDAATNGSTQMQNAEGNLAEAYTCTGTCPTTSKITDEFFSATTITSGQFSGGTSVQTWESTPNSGGYFLTTDSYYPNGALGNRTLTLGGSSIGFPNVTYGLDGEGRPYSATDSTNSITTVATTTYNAASSPTQITFGNVATGSADDVDTITYDSNTNRPTNFQYQINATGSSTYDQLALTWNPNGSLQQMIETDTNDPTKNQTCSYSADDLSRIASVSCGGAWAQNFTYDPMGNITKTGSGSYSASYSAATNQVSGGLPVLPTYDANGNEQSGTGAKSISWNAYGQMVSVTPLSGSAVGGTYDAVGRLVENNYNGSYLQLIYGPSSRRIADARSGSLAGATIPLPGGTSAIYGSSGTPSLRHVDWLGSSRLLTSWTHTVKSKEAYAPFGETYNGAGSGDQNFTGQDQLTVYGTGGTGIYDFLFRRYDPGAGRWLSPDPSGWDAVNPDDPQSLDRYAYVTNRPMNWIDPLGLCSVTWATFYYGDPNAAGGGVVSVDSINMQEDGGTPCASWGGWQGCDPSSDVNCGYNLQLNTSYNGGNPYDPSSYTISVGGGAPGNPPKNCLWEAAKAKGISIGLDIVGAVPLFGNAVSGGAGIVRAAIAVDHVITKPSVALATGAYGAYGAVAAGPENPTDSLVGAGSAGAGIGLALADASLEGTKAIPLVGNAVSVLTLGWDVYQAYKTYQACMATP